MPEFESSDGVTCSYLRLGGEGPRILFVHATGFCSTVWRPFAEALQDRYECWALDVRSHGHSTDQSDGAFLWEHTAHDVLGALDAIDCDEGVHPDRWRGVGHSMGGASLLLAEEQRPGTFSDLWVFEPIVFPSSLRHAVDDPPPIPLAEGAERRRAVFESLDTARANFSSKAPMSTFHPAALDGYLERGFRPSPGDGADAVRLSCDPLIEATVYRTGATHRAHDALHTVQCPVTVVSGDPSVPGAAMLAPLVAEALPASVFLGRPELGHFGPLEAPLELAGTVRDAFAKIHNCDDASLGSGLGLGSGEGAGEDS